MKRESLIELARVAPSATPSTGARERVWAGLRARERRRAHRFWLGSAGAAAALALAIVALRPRSPSTEDPRVLSLKGKVEVVSGGQRAAGVERALLRGDCWVETSQGEALVGATGDFLVWALQDTRFRVSRTGSDVWVHLDRGEINVWSAPRSSETLWVATPRHRVAVVGTMFSVEFALGERIAVAKGAVDLYRGRDRFAHLSAGETWARGTEAAAVPPETVAVLERLAAGETDRLPSWTATVEPVPRAAPASVARAAARESSDPPPAVAPRPRPRRSIGAAPPEPPAAPRSAPAAPREPARDDAASPVRQESPEERLVREAESLERNGDFRGAAKRYESLARGEGLDAEWALYRLGTLRQHKLGDGEGALRAWREHRRRFPNGSLRQETHLSIVEALVRLERNREALEQTERFLREFPASERRAEMERLRERLRDFSE